MFSKQSMSFELKDAGDVEATLTITMKVREWRHVVEQANERGGNGYVLAIKYAIDGILEEAEKRYIKFASDARECRAMLDATPDKKSWE